MLSRRLTKLIEAIPRSNTLADVGCDHGYVGIGALERGVADKVIFADISAVCLEKARTNCPAALQDKASFVCQDGLGQICCDTAVICGMGGLEILSILNGAKHLPDAVVLQPMRNIVDTRKYVAEHYEITLDVTVYDGKFYSVIVGQNVGTYDCRLSELELNFGVTNINNPDRDFILYLQHEQTKLSAILKGCNSPEVSERLALVNEAMEQTRRKL